MRFPKTNHFHNNIYMKMLNVILNFFGFNMSYRHAFYPYKSRFRRLCHYQAKQFNESVLYDVKITWIQISLVSMIRKYHNYKLQTNPWYCEDEPHNNHETPGRQTKQNNQLSLPHRSMFVVTHNKTWNNYRIPQWE